MATAKFNLRQKANPSAQTIFLIFRHQKEKLVYPTGYKVAPKYWSDEHQKVKNVTHVPNKDEINNFLNELRSEALAFASKLIADKKPVTKDELKNHLNHYTGKSGHNEHDLFGFIKSFIEQSATRVNPDTGTTISPRTIQKYNTTLSVLSSFAASYSKPLTFDTIDTDFYEDYVKWMQKKQTLLNDKEKEPYSTNTIGKNIQTLKVFLNAATEKGINTNKAFKTRKFKTVREESDSIYLTEKDLSKIYNLDLSSNPRLERVRDLFIVGVWTGLRFSDFTEISPENIRGDFLHMEQFKTGGKVVIPIHQTVKEILKKYNNALPKSISNQKMNDYIKEVCELAGITEKVQKGITKGGKRVIKTFEKWDLVSTHTARRSFATNLYKSGFPTVSIMRITGHKTEKAFLKYIKVTPEEHAELLQLHWEKKNSPLKVVS